MTKEELLEKTVLEWGGDTRWCALGRLPKFAETNNTVRAAKEVGFTEFEAYGIMDGWDTAAGNFACYHKYTNQPGFADGWALGKRLFEAAAAAGKTRR